MPPPITAQTSERQRLSLDLTPDLVLLLDNVSDVLAMPKSQVVHQALLESLPRILERVDLVQKRVSVLRQQQVKGGKR